MCDPILAALLKMRPHYGQSIRENATQSSGTSPLASYKEVPPRAVKLLRSYKRPKFTSPQLFARYQRVICLLSVSSWCFEKAIDYKATFTSLSRVRSYSSPSRAGSQAYTLTIVTSLLTRRRGEGEEGYVCFKSKYHQTRRRCAFWGGSYVPAEVVYHHFLHPTLPAV